MPNVFNKKSILSQQVFDANSVRCSSPAVRDELMSCRVIQTDGSRTVFDNIEELEFDETRIIGSQIRQPSRTNIRYRFLPAAKCVVTELTEFETGEVRIPPSFRMECTQDVSQVKDSPQIRSAEGKITNTLLQISASDFPEPVIERWEALSTQLADRPKQQILEIIRENEEVDELEVELFEAFAYGYKGKAGLEAASLRAQDLLNTLTD